MEEDQEPPAVFEESDSKDIHLDIKGCVCKSDCLHMFSLGMWLSIQSGQYALSPPVQAGMLAPAALSALVL